MSQSTPKKHKLEVDLGLPKDTVKSSLVLEEEGRWKGKELLLIQIPNNVNISQLNGKKITFDPDHTSILKLEDSDSGKSVKRRYEVDVCSLEQKDSQTTLLVPSSKPGQLKAGPPLSKCVRLQQIVEVPPVVLPPSREEDECKVEMPTGLKQRWKPFGYRNPVKGVVRVKSKHKAKKKSHKHNQEHK